MCCVCLRLDDPFDQRSQVDILLSLKEEDSYGLPLVLAGDFGGFLSQPPYFSGGLRRGFTFGLPTHRSFRRMDFRMRASKEQGGNGPYIPGLKRQNFTARLVSQTAGGVSCANLSPSS